MKAQPREQDSFFISWIEESVRRSYRITRDETIVGRKSDCDVNINNQHISRRQPVSPAAASTLCSIWT
jgi:hypothetical protein